MQTSIHKAILHADSSHKDSNNRKKIGLFPRPLADTHQTNRYPVVTLNSLLCPQAVRRGEARETRDDMWGEKVNMGSKVTPVYESSQIGGGHTI